MADSNNLLFKIIMLGDTSVGKSQMLQRFTKDKFTDDHVVTIGAEFATKNVQVSNGVNVQVQIWDTAGQEKFRSITRAFYRGAVGAVLVYDISNLQSFKNCNKWIEEIKQYNGDNQIAVLLVGNKKDLVEKQQVNNQHALDFAQSKQLALAFCSAKTGENINETFNSLIEEIYSQLEKNQQSSINQGTTAKVDGQTNGQKTQEQNKQNQEDLPSRKDFQKNGQSQSLVHPKQSEKKKKESSCSC